MIAVKVPLTSVNLPGELFIQDKIKRLKRNVNLTRFNLQNQGKRRKPPPRINISGHLLESAFAACEQTII
ncbi:MAG: hypothetical protein CMI03_17680 [Oceanospirillaceae bacterium]|nr:hypothetical protein [Oceanospirillaceae bacterium]MBS54573.1 hypothetical protein [Oceanospirillaceae bacterium]